MLDALSGCMKPSEACTRACDLRIAGLFEKHGRAIEILRDGFARCVKCSEIGATRHLTALARPLKKGSGLSYIALHTDAAAVQQAELRTAFQRTALATLLKQFDRPDGIHFHAAGAALQKHREACAARSDVARARALEEIGGEGLISEDVLAFFQLESVRVTGLCIAGLTRIAETLRFFISWVTGGEEKTENQQNRRTE